MNKVINLNVFLNASSGVERRASLRYDVFALCEIKEMSACVFTIRDVSEGGCQIQGESVTCDLEKGSQCTLNISPHTLTNKQIMAQSFSISAGLVWIDKGNKNLRMGFQFTDKDSDDLKRWIQLVAGKKDTEDISKRFLI